MDAIDDQDCHSFFDRKSSKTQKNSIKTNQLDQSR